MNGDEAKVLLKAIANVDNFQPISENPKTLAEKCVMWAKMLYDIPAQVALNIVAEWYMNNKQSITISDIRAKATVIVHGELPSAEDALINIYDNIKRYGFYKQVEGMAALSECERLAVKSVGGYAHVCNYGNDPFERQRLQKAYEAYATREQQQRQTPQSITGNTEKLRQLMQGAIKGIGDGDA